MDDPVIPRAEINEIAEEDVIEEDFHDAEEVLHGLELNETEKAFHGFGRDEVEEALELQALFRANNEREVTEEVSGAEIEVSPIRRENLSPKERRKRKAAARARQ